MYSATSSRLCQGLIARFQLEKQLGKIAPRGFPLESLCRSLVVGLKLEQAVFSCRDMRILLNQAIRSRQMTPEAILRPIGNRHRLRRASIRSAEERQYAAEFFKPPYRDKVEVDNCS